MKYSETVEIERTVDANNKELSKTEKRTTHEVKPLGEPDYIKLYTDMWCEFNKIPVAYRNLFLELVMRMSYANAEDPATSQIVYTGRPNSETICKRFGWQIRMYQKGLKVLCDCDAIRKVNRGVYQINPNYAGRGTWRYNPTLKQGGVSELVATFDFVNKTVDTNMVFSNDDDNGVTHIMSATEEMEETEE